ncbi:SAM-dependent methyltransferase [Desulfonema limicola]|uniref:Methyltransferase n=1 Tax=Desulfonema limicola TaxID=45656 RepID=A0A975BA58_9BACT|nr:site-specific DNA-methyltransferase [Desulfonema limicola]QTA81395.1 SAM-dependent methyltransferase [Desulfonema limicola]
MNKIQIEQGDVIELFSEIKNNSVDLIIADPPYNLGKNYGNNQDLKGFEDYLSFSSKWLNEAYRVLKPNGTIYVFMGVRFISYLFDILDKKLGMFFNSWICWHYTQGMGKKIGFSPRHDDILMFNKTQNFTFNLDNVRVPQKYYRARNNMRGANPGDVWKFSHVHYCNPNRQEHPTQKPEGLMERMVLASSNETEMVLDPFCGSGTTLRVCQQLNRNCIGFELNPDYIQMTKKRLSKPFTGFDSIDERMERVPLDLSDYNIREEYLASHIKWFLQHHNGSVEKFNKSVEEMYGDRILKEQKKTAKQISLF